MSEQDPASVDAPNVTVTLTDGEDTAIVRRIALEVIEGPQRGRTFTASDAEGVTIGAHEGCDLVLDDPTVSRFHCELQLDRRARIRDVGSRNGTFVDGVQIGEAFLRDGARLRLGRSVVRVELGAPTSAPTPPTRASFGAMVGA